MRCPGTFMVHTITMTQSSKRKVLPMATIPRHGQKVSNKAGMVRFQGERQKAMGI